jgi:hypothetical protein
MRLSRVSRGLTVPVPATRGAGSSKTKTIQ